MFRSPQVEQARAAAPGLSFVVSAHGLAQAAAVPLHRPSHRVALISADPLSVADIDCR